MTKIHAHIASGLGLVLALTACLGGIGCDSLTEKDIPRYSIEQFLNTTSLRGSSFSHDDQRVLYSSDKSGVFNLYSMPLRGGVATQLTHSTGNSLFALSYFPHDNRILYRSDEGGNELTHIHLRDEDGSVMDLTSYEGVRAVFHGWSHDGLSFYFSTNRRDPKFMDVYAMETATLTSRLIFQNDFGYSFGTISPDEHYLALRRTITQNNSEMYLHDLQSGETLHISPHTGDVNYGPVGFSADSRRLVFRTDEGSEFTYLASYDLESGQATETERAAWDITSATLSRDGKYRVVTINNDGRTEIRVTDTARGQPVTLPALPAGAISGVQLSRSEKLMAFYLDGPTAPRNLYVYEFATEKFRRLTDALSPEIDPDHLAGAAVVRFSSFDGMEIPAVHYEPLHSDNTSAADGGKIPGLVWVHGGPGGQSRLNYNGLAQYLVNHGYAFLAVNNRGSSGYGKSFYQADDRKHGEADLADCVAGKEFLASSGTVDPERIGIIGGSYGGYMVLAALAFQPQEFAVGVDLFGISNWPRTLSEMPPWWEAIRVALYQEMGDPTQDSEYLHSISPLFHAENISRPLMVLQGANDPRVLKVESDEIVAAARRNNVPVEYIVFEDEGHGFLKKENRIEAYRRILAFLDTHLKGEQGP